MSQTLNPLHGGTSLTSSGSLLVLPHLVGVSLLLVFDHVLHAGKSVSTQKTLHAAAPLWKTHKHIRSHVQPHPITRPPSSDHASTPIRSRVHPHPITRPPPSDHASTLIRSRAHPHPITRPPSSDHASTLIRSRVHPHPITRPPSSVHHASTLIR